MKPIFMLLLLVACSSPQKPSEYTPASATPQAKSPMIQSPATEEAVVPVTKQASAPVHNDVPANVTAPALPVAVKSETERSAAQTWKLKNGKLDGPFAFGHPSVISKTKNKKGNGTTTETCYRYATFAVVEMRSSDEVGAAEVSIRHDPPKGFNLCMPEFKGKTSYLKNMIEGYFAGVAGGHVLIDGADSSEGQTQFQLYEVESSKEVLKSYHHPSEEFTILKNADNLSLEYFGKMAVKCDLAQDGEKCWKQVLSENKVAGKTPMPDCRSAYDQSKTPYKEPALAFTRVRVSKPWSAVKFLGGKSTCQPAP